MKRNFQVDTQHGPVSGILGRPNPSITGKPGLIVAIHGGTYTSKYFDVAGYSLIDKATAQGFDIVALDRPGYGHTAPLDDGKLMLDRNASRISALLPELLAELGLPLENITLIGHSMGGVIASTIAAEQPQWPLKGIIGTGFAQSLPDHLAEAFAGLPQQYYIDLPTEMKDQLMFGPPETLSGDMPRQSHVSNTQMPRAEAIDIAVEWRERATDILKEVKVPVYYKLAEFEQLWHVADQQKVAEMYCNAPRVETGIFTGTGHCIDFHKRGGDFHDEILAFTASL